MKVGCGEVWTSFFIIVKSGFRSWIGHGMFVFGDGLYVILYL